MDVQEIRFLVRFIEESDAIESIDNPPGNIRRQLDEEINLQRVGHGGALLRMRHYASERVLLTERMVKMVQQFITEEQHLKGAPKLPVEERGHWREHGIVVGGRLGTHWQLVPEEMSYLIAVIRKWQDESRAMTPNENVRAIADFHYRYERIHPFADGNGRSGRALVYYLYRWAGLEPFVFTNHDKRELYYPCFNEFGPDLMRRYFLERTQLS